MHGSMTHLPSLHTSTLRHNLQEALDTAHCSSIAVVCWKHALCVIHLSLGCWGVGGALMAVLADAGV